MKTNKHHIIIELDEEAFLFLETLAGENKSVYINQLLKQEKQRILSTNNLKEYQDENYQKELSEWDATNKDGL